MKNEYDDKHFFDQYAQMTRSKDGLAGAGEWHQLKKMFPPLEGGRVLDLGCGYGWHCKYAVDQGAEEVLGIDVSRRMIEEAKRRNADKRITYQTGFLEDYEYPAETWDLRSFKSGSPLYRGPGACIYICVPHPESGRNIPF